MLSGKLILEGVIQKATTSRGRIYPSNIFEKEMSELLNSGGKVSATRGCVTKLGSELYARLGSTEDELLKSYESFISDEDCWISAQAVERIIGIRIKQIKRKYT